MKERFTTKLKRRIAHPASTTLFAFRESFSGTGTSPATTVVRVGFFNGWRSCSLSCLSCSSRRLVFLVEATPVRDNGAAHQSYTVKTVVIIDA
jgi:hypothetical protein